MQLKGSSRTGEIKSRAAPDADNQPSGWIGTGGKAEYLDQI